MAKSLVITEKPSVARDIVAVLGGFTGVHQFDLGSAVTLYLNPAQVYVFDSAGDLLVAPGGN